MLNRRQMLSAAGGGFALTALLPGLHTEAWAQAPRRSLSLHIGVNEANGAAYPGGISNLKGCINDATAYRSMAIEAGFQKSAMLKNSEATIAEVTRYIFHAADHLQSGDIFFVSYAGHGAGVRDRSGDEPDGQDESWCLYDGLLLDDYLYSLWARFQRGVRLLVISDSCHSGSAARVRAAAEGLARELNTVDSASRSLLGATARGGDGISSRQIDDSRESARALSQHGQIEHLNQDMLFQPRTISTEQAERAYLQNQDRYGEQQRAAAGANRSAAVQASGILLAACQDHQLSWENSGGSPGGIFTTKMREAFRQRTGFTGYSLMHDHVTRQMPSHQKPNFFPFGEERNDFFNQKPFTV